MKNVSFYFLDVIPTFKKTHHDVVDFSSRCCSKNVARIFRQPREVISRLQSKLKLQIISLNFTYKTYKSPAIRLLQKQQHKKVYPKLCLYLIYQ